MLSKHCRIAWLLPSTARGNYWQPLFREFSQLYPQTKIYTGLWSGFTAGCENTFDLQVVGQMGFIETKASGANYNKGFIKLSPAIVNELLQFKPKVIFTNGFSFWTLLALLFKSIGRWRVIIAYEGSSPTVDYLNSPFRLNLRRAMVKMADAFITNSQRGKAYLTSTLQAKPEKIFARPYEVAEAKTLLAKTATVNDSTPSLTHRVFLFVGQVVPRKGLDQLLKACATLQQQNYSNYTLQIIGDGEQRPELEQWTKTQGLQQSVQWLGWVNYNQLGDYFRNADVFVLPTYEDTWGMVTLEAMLFGKAILCSEGAGSAELVQTGKNGYVFDPNQPQHLADLMLKFIEKPHLSQEMGEKSRDIIAPYTPEAASQQLAEVVEFVLRVDSGKQN
ncbi:MAG: glycosyltransferase family 4 protein [Microcoleaceae cyanobacterium]